MIENFNDFNLNEAYSPEYEVVISKEKWPSSDGRDILVGVRINTNTNYLPAINKEELIDLKKKIESYLKNNK
ncbi:hypothetical protein [uncultured Methanobrevibacter sp.]|uniref:hypothetical protein n=1 Tax=uncultured Methanobrevibacter sp. TaxID=253161 RepID=UPI0025DB41D8|nr:hypothetical protein [uncultured Methanobrevibacter sp.]MBR4590498.1 hypothetical protein [Bacteroidaceae bacterium]